MNSSSEAAKCRLVVEALRAGNRTKIRAIGVSMMPAIWPGDVLVIESTAITEMQLGEVAVFAREGRIFAHRVVEKRASSVVTLGDRMPRPDPEVSAQELLGRVAGLERAGRQIPVATRPGLGEKLAREVVRFDRGVALFLAVARLLGKTEYPGGVGAE